MVPYARSRQVWGEPRSPAQLSVASASPAIASVDGTPFVFHDAAGRRWSRIKRIAVGAAVALVVLAGAALLAVTHVAPGKAPWFHATAGQPVSDWPARAAGGDPSSVPGPPGGVSTRPAAGAAGTQTQATPTITGGPSSKPSHGPPTPKPKRTKPPLFPPF